MYLRISLPSNLISHIFDNSHYMKINQHQNNDFIHKARIYLLTLTKLYTLGPQNRLRFLRVRLSTTRILSLTIHYPGHEWGFVHAELLCPSYVDRQMVLTNVIIILIKIIIATIMYWAPDLCQMAFTYKGK